MIAKYKRINYSIIKFLFLLSIATLSNEQKRDFVKDTDNVNDNQYQSLFRIPKDKIKYYANGESADGSPLINAFDFDWNTHWVSKYKNGENKTDSSGQVIETNLINHVVCNFSQEVTVDRLVYQAQQSIVGYPDLLSIYYLNETGEYDLQDVIRSINTASKVMFTFSKPITTLSIILEFTEGNKSYASARELQFFQVEDEDVIAITTTLLDYSRTRIKEGVTMERALELEEKVKKNINYEENIKPFLQRVFEILTGAVVYDPRREFSTKAGSRNLIKRKGELKNYMLSNLKMVWAGTNKQATGIYGYAKEKFIIYVEADENDPLPYAKFSQHVGLFNSWHTGDYAMHRGKNEFTYPTFYNYGGNPPIGGGPFYLTNPYYVEQQSENVKVYIESGTLFPLFRRDSDEKEFVTFLGQYVNLIHSNPNKYIDLMEIEGIRILHTIDAKRGYNIYKQGYSPQKSIETWDEYLKLLYKFDGIQYEETDPHYDRRSEYLNLNIRHMVQYGEAYAINEHVGIFFDGWLNSATYVGSLTSFGWGWAHEIGHTMDNTYRTLGEITNNMESKYDETALLRVGTRGEYAKTLSCLTPDGIDDDVRGYGKPFFFGVSWNFLVWWQIESVFIGYWGKLDNYYRYDNANGISSVEKLVYFSSIITNVNMSYHFQRWGFNFQGSEGFKYEKASNTFKNMMTNLLQNGTITNDKIYKFWYIDGKNYNYIADKGTGCYGSDGTKDPINILDVLKVESGYTLYLPTSTCAGHLGYEILENDTVISFTYGNTYTDTNTYDSDYTPVYRIRAYDRFLESNDLSEEKTIETGKQICSINGVYYDSISEAVQSISGGSEETTIILHKDSNEGKITINKNIKLEIDSSSEKSLTIYKAMDGHIFSISSGYKMRIFGKDNNTRIIIDGNGFSQSGAMINVNGYLVAQYVTMRNNINKNNGGAVYVYDGTADLTDCIIENNKAESSGAINYATASCRGTITNVIFRSNAANSYVGALNNKGTITITNCKFEGNSCGNNGGALVNDGGGIIKVYNTELVNNNAKYSGGAIYLNGNTLLAGMNIHNNTAGNNGGGIYINGENQARSVRIEQNTIIEGNTAQHGGGVYVQQGYVYYINAKIYNNKANVAGSCTYLNCQNGWPLSIEGTVLEGEIYKTLQANININTRFSLYDANPLILKFPISGFMGDMTLFKATSFKFEEEDLNKIKIFESSVGELNLGDDNSSIIVEFSNCTYTLICGEEVTENIYTCGVTVQIVYNNVPAGKYVSSIKDELGNTYTLGQKILLSESIDITIILADSATVTLEYLRVKEDSYVLPNSSFPLPLVDKDMDKLISFWKLPNDTIVLSGTNILVDQNMVITAKYDYYLTVKGDAPNGTRVIAELVEVKSKFVLPEFNGTPKRHKFKWIDKKTGKEYKPREEIDILENLDFKGSITYDSKYVYTFVGLGLGLAAVIAVTLIIFIYVKRHNKSTLVDKAMGLLELSRNDY